MRRSFGRAARFLVLPTLAVVVILAFAPGRIGLALRIYALVLAAVALALAVAALRMAYPRAAPLRRRARHAAPARRVPGPLGRLEQEAALGVAWSFDLHHRLRPRLRTIALELLASRHRLSLDDEDGRARTLLGEETWELVRADRLPPDDRQARGIPINDLGRVVESIERL